MLNFHTHFLDQSALQHTLYKSSQTKQIFVNRKVKIGKLENGFTFQMSLESVLFANFPSPTSQKRQTNKQTQI